MRIAAFGGFRSIPPDVGSAGSDKFAFELYPRIVMKGHKLTAYCRIYDNSSKQSSNYSGIKLKYFKTIKIDGFDSLLHSFKATWDIIYGNTADIVHIHSGANSFWAIFLRLAGKTVYISQFAMDWKRDKWPWYARLFYRISNFLTAHIPNGVIFDNIYTREYFEKKYKKSFSFIPYGSEISSIANLDSTVLKTIDVKPGKYLLFVGRFIPDKGIHLLVEAFKKVKTDMNLVLVGGSPNPSDYEQELYSTADSRVIFPGFIYGNDTNYLIKNAYAYIQPSLIEGLSPVILTVMGLGVPLLCSDIVENTFITQGNATHFRSNNIVDLQEQLIHILSCHEEIEEKAKMGAINIKRRFNWDNVTLQYLNLFEKGI
jgi:glycosyltransferase involved in cell wall biosynthesis